MSDITIESVTDYESDEDLASLAKGGINAKVSLGVDILALEDFVSKRVTEIFNDRLDSYISREVNKSIQNDYGSKVTFQDALESVISKKLDERYPSIVDGKIDELAEKIKHMKLRFGRYDEATLSRKAKEMVNTYIDEELSKEVKKQSDWLEQYARNYFAHNLFRAMGMMDKMLPIADPDNEQSK